MRRHLKTLASLLERGESVTVTIVVASTRGSPGVAGACLLMPSNSAPIGTIGGGIMEKNLIQSLKVDTGSYPTHPTLQTLEHREQGQSPSGLICGGTQTNLLFTLQPVPHLELVLDAIKHQQTGTPGTLIVDPNGIRLVPEPSTEGQEIILDSGNNDDWRCSLALTSPRKILICGAGHCGCALAEQMNRLDFEVTLFDQRSEPSLYEPNVERLIFGQPPVEALSTIAAPQSTYLVVMTHSYPSDLEALTILLPQTFKFVGLMGSPPKLKRIRTELAERGISKESIKRIRGPVGLQIGSDTPEEIAVSVAAQILLQEKASV